jgi:hypothetical protein
MLRYVAREARGQSRADCLARLIVMTPFVLPPVFVLLIIGVIVFLLITTACQHRRHSSRTDQRLCRGCGAAHPRHAEFCRRCGRRLG